MAFSRDQNRKAFVHVTTKVLFLDKAVINGIVKVVGDNMLDFIDMDGTQFHDIKAIQDDGSETDLLGCHRLEITRFMYFAHFHTKHPAGKKLVPGDWVKITEDDIDDFALGPEFDLYHGLEIDELHESLARYEAHHELYKPIAGSDGAWSASTDDVDLVDVCNKLYLSKVNELSSEQPTVDNGKDDDGSVDLQDTKEEHSPSLDDACSDNLDDAKDILATITRHGETPPQDLCPVLSSTMAHKKAATQPMTGKTTPSANVTITHKVSQHSA